MCKYLIFQIFFLSIFQSPITYTYLTEWKAKREGVRLDFLDWGMVGAKLGACIEWDEIWWWWQEKKKL